MLEFSLIAATTMACSAANAGLQGPHTSHTLTPEPNACLLTPACKRSVTANPTLPAAAATHTLKEWWDATARSPANLPAVLAATVEATAPIHTSYELHMLYTCALLVHTGCSARTLLPKLWATAAAVTLPSLTHTVPGTATNPQTTPCKNVKTALEAPTNCSLLQSL